MASCKIGAIAVSITFPSTIMSLDDHACCLKVRSLTMLRIAEANVLDRRRVDCGLLPQAPLRVSEAGAEGGRGLRAFRARRALVPFPAAFRARLDRAGIAVPLFISAVALASCAADRVVSPAVRAVSSATRSTVWSTALAARDPLS